MTNDDLERHRQRYNARLREAARRTCDRIVELTHPEAVLLVGSVARGEARESSDIDLIVVAASALSFKERMDLLYGSIDFEHETDVFWYTPDELARMIVRGNSFLRTALSTAQPLYGDLHVRA